MTEPKYDAIVDYRGKQTTIATIAKFYASKGLSPYKCGWTKSDLLRQIAEDLKELLIKDRLVYEVKGVSEAVEVLNELGYGMLTAGKRGLKPLAVSISKEAMKEQFSPPKADSKAFNEAMNLLEGEDK